MTPEQTPEDPSPDEMLSRLDEVLQDDEVPPDLDIPDEDAAPREDPWVPVDDAVGDDVALPLLEDESVEENPWQPTDDAVAADVELPELVEGVREDPWQPVPFGPVPEALSVRRALPTSPFELPRSRRGAAPLQTARTIPWRSTADLMEPNLPSLLCVADVTATGSRLLVAAWSWVDEGTGDRLRFRLSDDGSELEASASTPHEAALETTIRLADQELRLRLHLEAVRDQRGVVLGRDVLAGRFVVDPARDDWSEED